MQFMAGRMRRRSATYLLTIKQEDENLRGYLTWFNNERLTTNDQNKKITLAALLGEAWP